MRIKSTRKQTNIRHWRIGFGQNRNHFRTITFVQKEEMERVTDLKSEMEKFTEQQKRMPRLNYSTEPVSWCVRSTVKMKKKYKHNIWKEGKKKNKKRGRPSSNSDFVVVKCSWMYTISLCLYSSLTRVMLDLLWK